MATYVRSTAFFAAAMGMALSWGAPVAAQNALTLEAKIPLGDVRGRIDHMAVDLTQQRLFVAEFENDAVAVIDLQAGKVAHVISDVRQPQGLAYLPSTDTLFAANGGDGSLRVFRGDQYRADGNISIGEDADNIRVDAKTNRLFVSYGNGGFAIIDALTHAKVGDVALDAHPQGFQLDEQSRRIYANLPKEQAVVVLDYAAGTVVSKWQIGNGSNFPLALNNSAHHVLIVLRDPPRLVAFAPDGRQLANTETCGDADDMFFDAKRNRIYVSCGEGLLDVLDATAYSRVARIATVKGARTSLFVPELDRLFIAVRSTPEHAAGLWVFRPDR
jgi:DNA-binding beta-propeller fold protein YncE